MKLAIVGSETTTRQTAPWTDETFDLWVFNEAGGLPWCERCTAVLQLHLPEVYTSPHNRTDENHWQWLQENRSVPVYMQEVDERVPMSVRYPFEEICEQFLPDFTWDDGDPIRPFTNTISYAIALGLYQGYDEIHLYGVEMKSNTEYQYQRDNVAFWAGVAVGHGTKLVLHCAASIFDQPLYGYEGTPLYKLTDIEQEVEYLQGKMTEAENKRQKALDKESGTEPGTEAHYEAHSEVIQAQMDAGFATGILLEAKRYLRREDVSRHEFEQMAAWGLIHHKEYLSMMNYESGRAEAFLEMGDFGRYSEAAQKQMDWAYSAGVEDGKHYFNKSHMMEMDMLTRAAGGEKAREYVK